MVETDMVLEVVTGPSSRTVRARARLGSARSRPWSRGPIATMMEPTLVWPSLTVTGGPEAVTRRCVKMEML
ncbi:hypothetical protein MFORT_13935 [Mycolicibacterium fortuitum subsp. fortuitum DSM 46621 = ATCC 6841 = JCM 6387]|uniref:Uncharacterized protein n=1 Tax=Mycolicibacterium fortuitum subsp. fortuitum DSM 46621 = ATCC 6841 = JCM 6387 TaxID=1214102 RepID=K0V3L2_MYCFO|nr:hypothetical protein MFORT_13935 [Mycolicibacterium fortuitum subsp. fortuitum DSM 46621 = ATCC 6841 = JCM 6387]OBK68514.1 hypothetical protein A5654_14650 [Mycolicibacterium fortuitum]